MPKIVDRHMARTAGRIGIDPLIPHILPLDRIDGGFGPMHGGESLRRVVAV
jgi:S-(hydroxymethyl)glutathione dehydrogenase/alcohol dehydrogenase